MNRIKLICLFLFVFLISFPMPTLAKVFQWKDDKGKTHFTDDPSKIPLKYRTPPKQASGEATAKKRVHIGGGYSFKIAGNWDMETRGSLRYKLIFTKKRNGYEPSCALDEFKTWGSFEKFVSSVQTTIKKRFKNYKKNSQSEFYGKRYEGIKVSEQLTDMSGANVRRFLYYFNISDKKKIVITCSNAEATATDLEEAFDEIAGSLNYE